MYMRTVKMHVRRDDVPEFARAYEQTILTAFEKVAGCRSAVLMQSTREPEECVSLTFWKSEADIREFEQSGHYDKLIEVLRNYFIERYELQIRLTKDLKVDYGSSNEPEVRKFRLEDPESSPTAGDFIIRMVSLRFRLDKVDAFRKHYQDNVIPVLRSVPGCRTAFLASPSDSGNELISVTEWESEQAAQVYEHGGAFDRILESQRHFFATLVDFKMEDDKQPRTKTATSDDITVDKHRVLVGRRF